MRSLILIFIFLISTTSISLSEQKKITSEEDVRRIYQSVVKIDSIVPADARTANSLGTIRGGNGIVIDDKHILTIGYIVVEAETITITLWFLLQLQYIQLLIYVFKIPKPVV